MRILLSIIILSLVAFGCGSKDPTTLVVEENSPIVGSADTTVEALGIETLKDVLIPIIPLGVKAPYSHTETFGTDSNGQTKFSLRLFRGIKNIAADNQNLGEFQVIGIPSAPRGSQRIEITFSLVDRKILLSARDLTSNTDLQIQKVAVVPDTGRAKETTAANNRPYISNLSTKERSQFVPIANGIHPASSLTLYQGLPRWSTNGDEIKIAKAEILRIHGYNFYKQPLTVTEEEIESLRHLSSDNRTFGQHTWKFCGPFHPDYCLVWKNGKATYSVLICFGCDDVKLYGPGLYTLLDISKVKVLKSILLMPRGQRSDD